MANDIDSSLTLHDLYKESLVREMIEKTKNGGVVWTYLGGNQFTTRYTDGSTNWDFYLSKTQIGSLSYRYNFDVKKQGETYITLTDGPLPFSARDSVTKNLYELVEINTLQLDDKVVEAIRVVQGITGA